MGKLINSVSYFIKSDIYIFITSGGPKASVKRNISVNLQTPNIHF
jgi:hypothetical protein